MDFRPYGKTARLDSKVVITEKIDGTNGLIAITEDGILWAGSRNRWLSPAKGEDNYGFGQWAYDHAESLVPALGPGFHYGEWWGQGIARTYGLDHRVFSLFDTKRHDGLNISFDDGTAVTTVPIVCTGSFSHGLVDYARDQLSAGSWASFRQGVRGFPRTEGVVVRFTDNGTLFKVVWDKADEKKVRPEQADRPRKPQWTPEQIQAAREAAAERNR